MWSLSHNVDFTRDLAVSLSLSRADLPRVAIRQTNAGRRAPLSMYSNQYDMHNDAIRAMLRISSSR